MQDQIRGSPFIGMFILTVGADALEVIYNSRIHIEWDFVCTPLYTFLLM